MNPAGSVWEWMVRHYGPLCSGQTCYEWGQVRFDAETKAASVCLKMLGSTWKITGAVCGQLREVSDPALCSKKHGFAYSQL